MNTRQSTLRGRDHDSTLKNIGSCRSADDVSSSDEQIAKDTYGPTKRTKTDDLKSMDDVEKVSAAIHSSSSEVPIQSSSSSLPAAASEVSLTSASTTPVTTPIVNKRKGRVNNHETVDDSIHTPPNSSSNSSSTLLPSLEDNTDPSLAIPVTSEIFTAAAVLTEALLKKFPQKSMLKNEVDSFFSSDPLYKGSSIVGTKNDLHIIIRFYSEDSLKNSIGSAIADLHDVIFHLYDRNADRAAEADRTLFLSDIPLDIKPSHLKSCLARFGLVKKLTLRTPPTLYDKKPLLSLITKKRSTPFTTYGPSRVWVTVSGVNLVDDLHSIWTETKARSINIPHSQFSYRPKPYTHMMFPSQETMDTAMELSFQFNDRSLTRSTDKNVQHLYNKYKPAQHRNDSQKSRVSSRSCSRSCPRSGSKVRISEPTSSQSYASAIKQPASGSSSSSSSSLNNRDHLYKDPDFQSRQDDYPELSSVEAIMGLPAEFSDNPIRRALSQAEKDAATNNYNNDLLLPSYPAIPASSSDIFHATPVSNLINVSDAELMANPFASLAATVRQMLNPVVDSLKSIKAQQDVIEKQQRSLPSSAPSQDSQ
ncbi:hypothetical protein C1645_840888 [Glomus cerebriforme]|uniref:RRM domain-containing protein n=1 Tax=Glomus cerebriforme TaxID=658196 RepID=A0A397S4T4_9GLOM|nr:hypothetical protein C1645_840888 [Glomus cerebriforme]